MFDLRSYTEEQKERIRKKFEAGLERKDKSECWIWKGATRNRYGRLRIRARDWKFDSAAHRLAFVLEFGTSIPDHLCCCHTCDVTLCANPWHLKLASPLDNATDREIRGRSRPYGKKPVPFYQRLKLLERFVGGEASTKLAKEAGVHWSRFRTWLRKKEMVEIFGHVDLSHRNPIVKQAKMKAKQA